MSKTHPPYPPEYRAEAIRLVRSSGKPMVEIARRLEVSTETLRLWVRQADLDEGRRHDGLTTQETEEVRQLRREVKRLQEEKEILLKPRARRAEMGMKKAWYVGRPQRPIKVADFLVPSARF
jgi:transposase